MRSVIQDLVILIKNKGSKIIVVSLEELQGFGHL